MLLVANLNGMAKSSTGRRPASEKPLLGRKIAARRVELGLSLAAVEDATDGVVYAQLLYRLENGRAIGAEPSTVGQQRRKRGVPPTPGAAGVMRDKVLRLTRAGQSRQAVAEALGVSIGTVRHHLREARREGRLHSPDEDTT